MAQEKKNQHARGQKRGRVRTIFTPCIRRTDSTADPEGSEGEGQPMSAGRSRTKAHTSAPNTKVKIPTSTKDWRSQTQRESL